MSNLGVSFDFSNAAFSNPTIDFGVYIVIHKIAPTV